MSGKGSSSFAGKLAKASAWTIGGYATGQAIRFVGNLVLTRIMFPDVFGLTAIVFTFIQGLYMFSDTGAGPAVTQSANGDDPRFLDTAWTIQAIRGGILFGASCLIAAPVASFYGQPLLAWLIPAAGIGAVADGFASMSLYSAQRHLRVKWTTAVELLGYVVNITTIIAVAFVLERALGGRDLRLAWATIAGVMAGELTKLALSHLVVPGQRHRFRLDPQATRSLLGFGRMVFLSTVLTFLAQQSDRLLFAKMIPLEVLGVYGVAAALGAIPAQAVQRLSGMVLFPAYSSRQDHPDFRGIFWRARLPVLLAGATLVAGLASCGPFLIRILYDSRYVDAGPILQYLAAAAWFQMLESTNSAALLAQGRVRWMVAGNATKLAGLVVFLPLGFHLGGFPGALAGLVVAELCRFVVSVVGASRAGLAGVVVDVAFTAAVFVVSLGGFLAGTAVARTSTGNIGAFLVSGGTAALAGALAGLVYWHRRARMARGVGSPAGNG